MKNIRAYFACLLFFISIASVLGQASFDSLRSLVLASEPSNLEMQATVICPKTTDGVRSAIQSLSTEDLSLLDWSNAVSIMVRNAIRTNTETTRLLWHLRFRKLGENVRYDTLEGLFGESVEGASFSNPPISRVSIGNSAMSFRYTNYEVNAENKTIRIPSDPATFHSVVPAQWLLDMPQTIQAMFILGQRDTNLFVTTVKPTKVGTDCWEMRLRSVPHSELPLVKAIYSETEKKWLGIFVISPKGTITSAALAANGLGWPILSPTVFCDQLQARNKAGTETVISLIAPTLFTIGRVDDHAFILRIPTNWTLIDERKGIATVNGKTVGQVMIASSHGKPNTANVSRNRVIIVRAVLLCVLFTSCLVVVIAAIRKWSRK